VKASKNPAVDLYGFGLSGRSELGPISFLCWFLTLDAIPLVSQERQRQHERRHETSSFQVGNLAMKVGYFEANVEQDLNAEMQIRLLHQSPETGECSFSGQVVHRDLICNARRSCTARAMNSPNPQRLEEGVGGQLETA
jgi:hypothetical protein